MSTETITFGGNVYYRIFAANPGEISSGQNVAPHYWRHYKCLENAFMYIGDDARCFCSGCQANNHVLKWTFFLEDGVYFLKEGETCLAEGINLAAQLAVRTGVEWLRQFMKNLERPYLEEK